MITLEKWLPYLTKEERAEYDVLQTLPLDAKALRYAFPVDGRLSRLAKKAYDRLKNDSGIVEDTYTGMP